MRRQPSKSLFPPLAPSALLSFVSVLAYYLIAFSVLGIMFAAYVVSHENGTWTFHNWLLDSAMDILVILSAAFFSLFQTYAVIFYEHGWSFLRRQPDQGKLFVCVVLQAFMVCVLLLVSYALRFQATEAEWRDWVAYVVSESGWVIILFGIVAPIAYSTFIFYGLKEDELRRRWQIDLITEMVLSGESAEKINTSLRTRHGFNDAEVLEESIRNLFRVKREGGA